MDKLKGERFERIIKPAGSRRLPGLCAAVLLGLWLNCLPPVGARAQAAGPVPVFRHHVIFLLDSSGSVLERPRTLEEYHSVIRARLPALLGNAEGNGFGLNLYDPQRDLSSAFAFGLSPPRPFFAPSLADGFMRRLWFQQQGKTFDDLIRAAPAPDMRWTAINSAFLQGVRKARWEAEQSGALGRAFERTFLVVVSDGQANTSTDSLDEMRDIRGAALGAGVSDSDLRPDYAAAGAYNDRLTEFFALRTASAEEAGGGGGVFPVGNFKIFIRELRPHRLANLGDVLETGPDKETQLERQPHSVYAGTLSLSPRAPRPDGAVSYHLLGVEYRLPGQSEYQTAPDVPSPDRPLTLRVKVADGEIDRARASLRLSFLRRDPVYGQAVQVFEEAVRFRREPRRYVLGLIPITDTLMTLHGGLSQDQIVALDSVLIFAVVGFLIYVFLFPAPRAEMELTGDAAGPDAPLRVAFGRLGEQRGQKSVLGSLRFKNNAFRELPLVGRFRLAERRFDVRVAVEPRLTPGLKTNGKPFIGLDVEMSPERLLRRQTEGSQTTILLSPDDVADYTGEASRPAECAFTVRATQTGRRFGFWPFSRELEPRTRSFYLRFEPEEPDVRAALKPRVASRPTGDAGSRAYPKGEGVVGWLTLPHYVGRRDDPNAVQEFDLQISNEARHVCARAGSVRLTVVVSPAGGRGKSVEVPLGAPFRGVLRVEPHAAAPLSVPVRLPYEELPTPGLAGEDYILSATVSAADGQQWAPQTVRYGVRIGPDPRRTALTFKVATPHDENAHEWRWHSFGTPAEGAALKPPAAQVHWNVGRQKESSDFALIEFDNAARNGDGTLLLRLKPGAAVRPHPDSEPGLEPVYAGGPGQMVRLVAGGAEDGPAAPEVYSLGRPAEWRLDNEAPSRPVRLRVEFQPHAIERMERRPPHFPYVCELPFECVWRESADGPERRLDFRLLLDFKVVRYTGEHALAIDFGTSAVVVAFEESEQNIRSRPGDVSNATQRLQARYRELLGEWKASADTELKLESELEAQEPNPERATAFIPSQLMMRQDKQLGATDFVLLPVSLRRMSTGWDRTVYYLKGLILRGDKNLPYQVVDSMLPLRWKDAAGRERKVPQDEIPVDEIIRSSYRNLMANYVEPLLKKQDKLEYLDRLVVSHPNNFTLSHIFRVRKILAETFPQFSRIHLLSESNAVAVYCARNAARFFREPPRAGGHRHLLVYDIGAGTVDLTYTRLEWGEQDGVTQLREMRVLFKSGLPVAGNRLDACLATLLDEKLNSFVRPLRQKGVALDYRHRIVNPNGFNRAQYPARMLHLKKEFRRLKGELSESDKDLFHVRVSAAARESGSIATVSKVNDNDDEAVVVAGLREAGITRGSTDGHEWIGIPLSRAEIYGHPDVRRWLDLVSDELIRNLAGALKVLGIRPEIDTLILSGRTAQFPPLRERLFAAFRRELGLADDAYDTPELERNEKKEAVALGSLLYTLFHGRHLRLVDRNVWAKYGVIYHDGLRQRFQEFFGYASERQPGDREATDADGMRTVLFRRTLEIPRASGPLEIAATFSHDPDADLLDPQSYLDHFQVIHTIGAGYLGPPGRLKVRLSNNEDDTIRVDINPGGVQKSVTVKGYREDDHIAQMDWPYQPLKR
ncbi:MAG TPA: hypothetical protein VGV38_06405 [Pyrinomonadaceae bacterium]|nr:hypothetical protein [Pyrinomonadaceae bacterium]